MIAVESSHTITRDESHSLVLHEFFFFFFFFNFQTYEAGYVDSARMLVLYYSCYNDDIKNDVS
jgi:hypothetical protein